MTHKAFRGKPKKQSLWNIIKKFFWKNRFRFGTILLLIIVSLSAILGVAFLFLDYSQYLGYSISQEEVVIDVVGKDTKDLIRRRCTIPGPDRGCAVYQTITNTLFIITTSNEQFHTEAKIYYQLEAGEKYKVVVIGWPSSILPPRRLSEIIEER